MKVHLLLYLINNSEQVNGSVYKLRNTEVHIIFPESDAGWEFCCNFLYEDEKYCLIQNALCRKFYIKNKEMESMEIREWLYPTKESIKPTWIKYRSLHDLIRYVCGSSVNVHNPYSRKSKFKIKRLEAHNLLKRYYYLKRISLKNLGPKVLKSVKEDDHCPNVTKYGLPYHIILRDVLEFSRAVFVHGVGKLMRKVARRRPTFSEPKYIY